MGGKQLGFSDYELTTAKKQPKRAKVLSEMEAVVPWQALIALIEPHDPKASKKGGRPPYPLATIADPPVAAVVFAERSGHGRSPDRGAHHAPLCRHRADQRSDSR
jgi:hypothetical protein